MMLTQRSSDFATAGCINQVVEMLNREPINCNPKIVLYPDKKKFYDFTIDDVKIIDYPRDRETIKQKNKHLKFPLGI